MEGELTMAERKKSYKEVPGKYGKAKVVDETPTEELKKKEVKEEKKKPVKKKVKKGIVNTNALNVRTAPEKGDNIICIIRKGAEVVINDLDGVIGWLNITVEATPGVKVTGFVMAEFIKEV